MRPNLFAAAFIGAASVFAAAEALARCSTQSIPLPDAPLLRPAPESSCVFQTAGDASDPAAQIKALDDERECYRQAGAILHGRLLQLQISVGETVKAIKRVCPSTASTGRPGARKSSIPLPGAALLKPLPELDCTFKDSRPAGARPAPAQAAAVQRMKLDYELQCYRHSAMILRGGLDLLQAAVSETIWALNGIEQAAATGGPVPQPSAKQQQPAAKQKQPAAKQQQPAAKQQPAALEQPVAMQQRAAADQANDRKQSRTQEVPCAVYSYGRCVARDPDPRVRFMLSNDQ